MPDVTDVLSPSTTSNGPVTINHFGSNFLYDQDVASEGSNYDTINSAMNIKTLRFPGGTLAENNFDITNTNDLAKLELFIEYCSRNGHNAMIVLPTFNYFDDGSGNPFTAAEQAEIQTYVRHVLNLAALNGVTIQGFEMGNELYQFEGTETDDWSVAEFADLQAKMADLVHDEIGNEADIYIQAGRTASENQAFVAAFTDNSTDDLDLNDVDGIITHLYYGVTNGDLSRIGGVKSRLELLDTHWGSYGLDTIVTEWNTSESSNGGSSTVSGLARLAALSRGFGDMIGHGVDTAMFWTTIAAGGNGRATLADQTGNILPSGYWYQLITTTLVDTELVSDYNYDAAFLDDNGDFAGYSYIFQGTGAVSDDYHVIYASGIDGSLDLDLDISGLTSSNSYVYATVIRQTGSFAADDRDVDAYIEVLTDLGSLPDITLGAYEFVEINVVTGHGVTLDTSMFHDVDDDLTLTVYADTVTTHAGNDTVEAVGGNDEIHLGSGDDLVYGGYGNDKLWGDAGNDTLRGDNGYDALYGGDGDDKLVGIFGNDVLHGDSGTDQLWGGRDNDKLFGGDGWDKLKGEDGNDTLDGGTGNDRMYGGNGTDTFVFQGSFGQDRIYDFTTDERIDLTAISGINDIGDLALSQDAGAAVITIGSHYIKLIGFDYTDLISDNFLF